MVPSEPVVRNCFFTDNYASEGSAVFCEDFTTAAISNCSFLINRGGNGVVSAVGANDIDLVNCYFWKNRSNWFAGALYIEDIARFGLRHCTLNLNEVESIAGGIYIKSTGNPTVVEVINSILWGNEFDQIFIDPGASVELYVTYSDVEGGWTGDGNINADPLLQPGENYHLKMESPCVDAGTDAGVYFDLDGQDRPFDGFDMGCDEFILGWPVDAELDPFRAKVLRGYSFQVEQKLTNLDGVGDACDPCAVITANSRTGVEADTADRITSLLRELRYGRLMESARGCEFVYLYYAHTREIVHYRHGDDSLNPLLRAHEGDRTL